MTAPSVNVVRALDDHVQADIDSVNTEIMQQSLALAALYRRRAALEALRDIRQAFAALGGGEVGG